MPDLDAAIRAKLELVPDMDSMGEDVRFAFDVEMAQAALIAVLDLHAAPERALPGEIHCGELIDWVQGGCPTVRAIAQALGIEVTQ